MPRSPRKPSWLRVRVPGGQAHQDLKRTLRQGRLHTVCEEALCPNMGECWRAGTATVMVLGDTCTRGCRFCGVKSGKLDGAVDAQEPVQVAEAVASMALNYVVLTMVNRDDLPDGGAQHVAATIGCLRSRCPAVLVEALVGDFAGRSESIDTICAAAPDVFAHNLEVVRSMTSALRDGRCGYDRSLAVLRAAKDRCAERLTKSSLMVGVGEGDDEVVEAMTELRAVGVDILTIGQYLQPTRKHAPVHRYVHPDQFAEWQQVGEELGFLCVASGPLVRSSYRAAEVFVASRLRGEAAGKPTDQTADVTAHDLCP